MNIGDYARTNNGLMFGKITDICIDNLIIWYEINGQKTSCWKGYFKSSPNIIDLIEVGDIIRLKNFAGVYRVCDVSNGKIELDYQGELGAVIINNSSDIKSIVTHEQFASMEYKLGDK